MALATNRQEKTDAREFVHDFECRVLNAGLAEEDVKVYLVAALNLEMLQRVDSYILMW